MTKNVDEMDYYTQSRWISLMLAINKIDDECKKTKTNFNNIELKPIPIKKFINVMSSKLEKEIEEGKENLWF